MNITPAEQRVLSKLCEGKQDKIIAHELGIATVTVKTHVQNMLKKNDARNRIQLFLMHLGLLKKEATI